MNISFGVCLYNAITIIVEESPNESLPFSTQKKKKKKKKTKTNKQTNKTKQKKKNQQQQQ